MATELDPVIGNWYRDVESKQLFEIISFDISDGAIDIQYFDSELSSIELEAWYDMTLELAAEPEDWSGPFDDLVTDDYGDTDVPANPKVWGNAIDSADTDQIFESLD